MKHVLDASVGIKWVMNEIDSAKARQLRDDFRSRIHDLIAPRLIPPGGGLCPYEGRAAGDRDRRDDAVGRAHGGPASTLSVQCFAL
jgi:hypothetical protein